MTPLEIRNLLDSLEFDCFSNSFFIAAIYLALLRFYVHLKKFWLHVNWLRSSSRWISTNVYKVDSR